MLRYIHHLHNANWLGRLASVAVAALIVGGCGGSSTHRRPAPLRARTPERSKGGFGNFSVYTLQVGASHRAQMLVLNGVTSDPNQTKPPFDSRGSLELGASLCDGSAIATFIVTGAHSGNVFHESVPARITHSTLDHRPVRCPLRTLSMGALGALTLRLATLNGRTVALLNASPQRGGGLFSLLKVSLLRYTYPAVVPPSPLLASIWLSERGHRGAGAHRHLVALRFSYSGN
jgi:hypothetical protein